MSSEAAENKIEKAEELVEESKALNAAVSQKLATPSSAQEISMTSAPAAAAPSGEQNKGGHSHGVSDVHSHGTGGHGHSHGDEQPAEPLYLGLSARNWGIIAGLFIFFYICLAMIFWSVLEVGVVIRGSDYHSLPSFYYGEFSRDFYYKGFGAPVDKQIELLPWVKTAVCPGNTNGFVCTPGCDDLFVTPPSYDDNGKMIENSNCNKDCGVQCFNP